MSRTPAQRLAKVLDQRTVSRWADRATAAHALDLAGETYTDAQLAEALALRRGPLNARHRRKK